MDVMGEDSDDMRHRARWMLLHDDSILELMRDEGNQSPLSASREGEVARVDISAAQAGKRLRKLEDYGLVDRYDRGIYRLSDKGCAYLNEELDASSLKSGDEE